MDFIDNLSDLENYSFSQLASIMVILIMIIGLISYFTFEFFEFLWVRYVRPKPFFKHLYFIKRKLTNEQFYVLNTQFSFYQDLSPKQKQYFEHRLSRFIKLHEFEGRSGLYVTDQHKVLIASTAVMLTFGYRNYTIKSLKRFIIYPNVFTSRLNKALHKGEYNPALKAVVFSWKDFLEGYEIDNDNFNLGIHEIVHAIHFDFINPENDSISAIIFMHFYKKINKLMQENTAYRERLISSKYLQKWVLAHAYH